MTQLLHTGNTADRAPLLWQGVRPVDCWGQIRGWIEANRGPFEARGLRWPVFFLAEPVAGAMGKMDWYCTGPGEGRSLASLPEAERRLCLQRLNALLQACGELSRSEAGRNNPMGAGLLENALHNIAPEDVRSVGGWPVLVNWGLAPRTGAAGAENIMRLGSMNRPQSVQHRPAPRPVPPPQTEAAKRSGCLGIVLPTGCSAGGCLSLLIPLLLLALLIWLLSMATNLLPTSLPWLTPAAPDQATAPAAAAAAKAEADRSGQLQRDINTLHEALRRRAALCVPLAPARPQPEPKPRPEPVPEPEEHAELPPESLPFFGAPAPEPEPEPDPQPNAPLQIPKQAADNNDTSFLEGCWRAESGLVNTRTNRPVQAEFCFKKNGSGTRTIYEDNGDVCEGNARATFSGGSLKIRAGKSNCRKSNRAYSGHNVICTGSGTSTICRGREKGGDVWDATFTRRR